MTTGAASPPDSTAPPPDWAGPPPAVGVPSYGAQMKSRNAFLVWIVWPILTLGIYHFVWYYKIHNEMLHFDPRQRSTRRVRF